ncbi:MAG: glycerophosphodiester phosphodiesterase family protein [Fuerstiella sp.]
MFASYRLPNFIFAATFCLLATNGLLATTSFVATVSGADDNLPSSDTSQAVPVVQTTHSGPIVIAHRGASGYLPEHTTEAATLAHGMAVDFIEQDVVLSKDGIPVVLHDVTLNSVTNVAEVFADRAVDNKYFVFDFTLEELRRLSVTERQTSTVRFPRGQGSFRISTLAEHLQLIRGLNRARNKQIGVYVELKKPSLHKAQGLDLTKKVLSTLAEFGYNKHDDNIFLQCFEGDEIKRLRTEFHCRLPLIQLYSKRPSVQTLSEISKYADGIGVNIEALVEPTAKGGIQANGLAKQAHDVALQVHAWTFRTDQLPRWAATSDELLNLLFNEARINGLFADQPDVVLHYLEKTATRQADRGPFHLLNDNGK